MEGRKRTIGKSHGKGVFGRNGGTERIYAFLSNNMVSKRRKKRIGRKKGDVGVEGDKRVDGSSR